MVGRKVVGVLAASALAAGFAAVPRSAAAGGAPAPYLCSGGTVANPITIPAGTYGAVTVSGACTLGTGTLTASSLTITSGGAFAQFFSTSTLTVLGNVNVGSGGIFFIGCGTSPLEDANCPDNPSATTDDSIGGALTSLGAKLLVVHFTFIGGGLTVNGGGAGLSCNNLLNLQPPTPGYVDFDYDGIIGNVSITHLRTCWAGFSDNEILGSVVYGHNTTAIPDGNFVGNNAVEGSLSCFWDSPTPHLSDVFPSSNDVLGTTLGQCVGEV